MILKYSNTRRIVCPAEMSLGETGTILYWEGRSSFVGRPVKLVIDIFKYHLITTDKYSYWSGLTEYNDVSTFAIELD